MPGQGNEFAEKIAEQNFSSPQLAVFAFCSWQKLAQRSELQIHHEHAKLHALPTHLTSFAVPGVGFGHKYFR
jgi:hypothetical protein